MNRPAALTPRRFAVRVDASPGIGTGHLVRCLALAGALRAAGADLTFVCAQLPATFEATLQAAGVKLRRIQPTTAGATTPFALDQQADSAAFLESAGTQSFDCVIVDHYGIDQVWESAVRERSARIFVIDDLADRRHDCDFLLDQSLPSPTRRYDSLVSGRCRLLLGPRFALLRPEFAVARRRVLGETAATRDRVVLFTGGGDPDNITGMALEAWALMPAPRAPLDVVIGAGHASRDRIGAQCAQIPDVRLHIQTQQMAELLEHARLLIGSAGTISWERCCLSVPGLMFSVADNQEFNLRTLAEYRSGISLGKATSLDAPTISRQIQRVLARPRLLARMARRAERLVDGQGAVRTALLLSIDGLALRAASAADDERAWGWRNAESTRRYFRDPRPVPLAEHRTWWARCLADPTRRLFIAHCGDHDVGVLRLDLDDESAEVSIYLDPDLTGLGLGLAVLRAVQRWVVASHSTVAELRAEILSGNLASEAAFTRAGFTRHESSWRWMAAGA